MERLRALLVLGASAAIVIGCGAGPPDGAATSADADATAVVPLPDSAVAQIRALVEEKQSRSAAQKKISSQLLYAKQGRFVAPKRPQEKAGPDDPNGEPEGIENLLELDKDGRVLVDIKGDVDAGLDRQVETLGGTVVKSSVTHRAMRAWMPLENIEALAGQPTVRAIRPALQARTNRADPPNGAAKFGGSYAQRVARVQRELAKTLGDDVVRSATADGPTRFIGAVTSQGSAAHGVDRARKFFNTNGAGVRIGVLSDSDDFKEASIASGDLPADTVTVPGESGRPGSGEGTAMMEIIHDLAPGAKLFFATAFNSPESFADNIRRLRFEFGCDIIVDDVIYFFESPYQDDIIAQAVNDVTADGALYFSSAGNQGNFSDGTSGTWEGDFKPAGVLPTLPPGYTVHDFDVGRVISNRIEASGGPLILHWSDPGSLDVPQSGNDYDLFVLDESLRTVLVAATDIQDGDDLPFEFLGFIIPPDLRVVVARNPGAQTRAIRILHFGGELGLSTHGGNYGHSAAHDAVAVAAVDVAVAIGGEFVGGPTTPVQLFSTDGHRRVFYLPNGVRVRGGVTFASGGGEFRLKPDVSGADGVLTNTPGFQPFFGTSAAAPHVAAIAALIKAAVPSNGHWRNRQALLDSALDIEGAGHDRDSGAGIVSAMGALQAAGAKPAAFLELGTVTASASGGSGPIVPGGGGSLAIQVLNNGGATASGVSGALSSSTPGVTVTQGVSAYPNLLAGGSGVNATPYLFSVDPSVACGTPLQFSLAVTFTGRGTSPTNLGFLVQAGTANPVPIVTSFTGPPASIPDNNLAGVNVPLAVSGVGTLARLVFSFDGSACSAAIGSTTVGLNHTWVGDLIVNLTSPGGTTLTLMNRPGGGGNSGNNFCQTVLDDGAATSIQSITSGGAPWTGPFRPANPLSSFVGENANGTWVLNVSDRAGLDTGAVRAFSLRASNFSCPAP